MSNKIQTRSPIPPLYQLAAEFERCYNEETGEWDHSAIKALAMDIDQKGRNIAIVLKCMDASIEAFGKEIKAMQARLAVIKRERERLRTNSKAGLVALGKPEIGDEQHRICLQKGRPKVAEVDVTRLPPEFVVEERKPNKKAILEHFVETGEIVEGCNIQVDPALRVK